MKRGEERDEGKEKGGGEEGEKKKAADATQLELSFVNETRCLRDKEDERVCMCVCDVILAVSLKD